MAERALGSRQRLAMGVLFDHGVWQIGAHYGIGSDHETEPVIISLVPRGLARLDDLGRYCLTMAGYAWLIRDAAYDLGLAEFGSDAAEAVEARIRHLAACTRLVGAHGGRPVDWRGNPV